MEIVDEIDPYPTLLEIDWVFDNSVILNSKNKKMSFESERMWLISPLDPREGERYTKPIKEELDTKEIDNLNNIIAWREDYVNLTTNGELSWRRICSYDIYLEDALDQWKNKLHEISSWCYVRIYMLWKVDKIKTVQPTSI